MSLLRRQSYRINLRRLQTLCGENYGRLSRLEKACGESQQLELQLEQFGEVRLRITQLSRYTTELQLAQTSAHPLLQPTRLTVRLYHDMRLAEVVAMQRRRTRARNHYPNEAMHQPDEKLQWNRYLSEWLKHLDQHALPISGWRAQVSGWD